MINFHVMGQYVSEIVFYKIVGQVQTKLWKWKKTTQWISLETKNMVVTLKFLFINVK